MSNSSMEEDSDTDQSGFECFFSDSDGSTFSDEPEPSKKRGRPLHHTRFPYLVKYVDEYLNICTTGAHNRRRDSNEYWSGCTGKDMAKYVNQRIHDSKGGIRTDTCPEYVSRATVRRLGLPPNQWHNASRYYKGLVQAKRGHKQYDVALKEDPDFQYTASQVNHLLELASIFREDVIVLSVDNKSKINLAAPAVSHQIRPRGLHRPHMNPNLPDHSYPGGCKLVPSGYMELNPLASRSQSARQPATKLAECLLPRRPGRARSQSPPRKYPFATHLDEHGRERLRKVRHGKLHVYVFAEYFYKSSSTRHANHLIDLLARMIACSGKSVVFLVTDGGSDWNGTFLINLFNYGRLWQHLKLDSLVLARYAPYNSRYNMIERRWGPLTKRLASVTFDQTLPGETVAPWKQNLSKEEERAKCVKVLDRAVNDCCAYIRPDVYKGFGLSATPVLSSTGSREILKDSDHEINKDLFSKASVAWRKTDPSLAKQAVFLLSHCRRSSYKLEFSRCVNPACECNEAPIKARGYMELLGAVGGCIPTPQPDLCFPGHYRTLLSMLCNPKIGRLDDALPQTSIFRCQYCHFLSFSKTDFHRHRILLHSGV